MMGLEGVCRVMFWHHFLRMAMEFAVRLCNRSARSNTRSTTLLGVKNSSLAVWYTS
jgi:hypothetical protein